MIWLIGNTGMVGREIEYVLKKNNIPHLVSNSEVDIRNLELLRAFSKSYFKQEESNWIINCAGFSEIKDCESNKDLAMDTNSKSGLHSALLAKQYNANLIYLSTDSVFDGTNSNAYFETNDPNPQTAYSKSMLAAENYIQETWDKFFILRTGWVYGKYRNNFVFTMLNLFLKKAQISVVDDQTGSPTYAYDLMEGILSLCLGNNNKYGLYHFCNKNKTDWYEFAREIFDYSILTQLLPTGVQRGVKLLPITSEESTTMMHKLQNTYLDCSKFERTFKYTIRDWKIALHQFLDCLPRKN